MNLQILLVKKTSNKKTGPMAVTIANTPGSCPSECPFKLGGCYAQNGPSGMHSRNALKAANDVGRFIRELPVNGYIRHFVSGDVCNPDDTTDHEMIAAIVENHKLRPDVKALTYTHTYKRDDVSAEYMNSAPGLCWNASCETEEDVKLALEKGWDAVMVIPSKTEQVDKSERVVEFDDYVRVVCPATYKDTNCKKCMLCGLKGRNRKGKPVVVAFPVHGAQSGKAASAINARNAAEDFSANAIGHRELLPMVS